MGPESNAVGMGSYGPRAAPGYGEDQMPAAVNGERSLGQQMAMLREQVMRQRKLLEELHARLGPMLNEPPHAEGRGDPRKSPMPSLSPISGEIRALGFGVQECNEVVQRLLTSLEI